MNVSEVDEMGSCNLESEMLPDAVPDGLDEIGILHQRVSSNNRAIIRDLPKHKLKKVHHLLSG